MNDHPKDFAAIAAETMDARMNVLAAQIRKLAELRDEGLLTDGEFSAAKAQLLAGL
jgi:hypothetical protein